MFWQMARYSWSKARVVGLVNKLFGVERDNVIQASSRRRFDRRYDRFGIDVERKGQLRLFVAALLRQSLFSLMSLSSCRVDNCSDGSHNL